jgi:regulator of sigma E protease
MLGFVPGLDLAHAIVAHVRPNSPAARAGIESGCVIEKVNGRTVKDWAELYSALRDQAGKDVTLTVRRSARPEAELTEAKIGLLDSKAFDPNDYNFDMFIGKSRGFFDPIMTTVRKESLGAALKWSLRESTGFMISTYVSIRSLILGNVSADQFVGPLGMGGIAVRMAERGFMHFFYFMAIISAVLAVMNFLPLPVVDGGHAVFLIIEKIRGKPLPIRAMNITQLIGLILLALVFLALTYQDIMRFF